MTVLRKPDLLGRGSPGSTKHTRDAILFYKVPHTSALLMERKLPLNGMEAMGVR